MEKNFISIVQNHPIGFEYKQPKKKDLLGLSIAIFADSKDQILSLIDNFANKAIGVIITPDNTFSLSIINQNLWHIKITKDQYSNIKPVIISYLNLLLSHQESSNTNNILKIDLNRTKDNYEQTSYNYNKITKTLERQVSTLKQEILNREKAETALKQQNHEYAALNEELKASEDYAQAVNEELIATTEELINTNTSLEKSKEKANESNKLKTEFINNMSHEIRTPMNGILGFCSLLDDPNTTPEDQKQYVDIINSSSDQLLRIIDDIIEISRLGTDRVKPIITEVCLNSLLSELFLVFNIQAKENNISLHLNKGLSNDESIIFTDASKVNKIISNLIENALKFTDKGSIEFGYKLKKDKLELYVKDNGIGISNDMQDIIFNRFSQAPNHNTINYGGLGLGLAIAKENSNILDGKISVKSKINQGTTFYVSIPYKPVNKISKIQ